jgi:transposase
MHWDMTSMSLYGAYPELDEGYPAPRFGHPKDRRPDLKQVQTGIAVSGDGGVPVFARAFDGGAGEVAQVVPAMQALQKLAGPARMLMVGDSKLISYPNLAATGRGERRLHRPGEQDLRARRGAGGPEAHRRGRGGLRGRPRRGQAT